VCGRKNSFTHTLISEEICFELKAAEKVLGIDEIILEIQTN